MRRENWLSESMNNLDRRAEEPPESLPVPEKKTEASLEKTLWNQYGIRPGFPLSMKIELLSNAYQLAPEQIAEVLHLRVIEVVREIEMMEQRWMDLGRGLSAQERVRARGKLIAEYERLLQTLDTQAVQEGDPRLLTLKVQVLEKLAKLKGLDTPPPENELSTTLGEQRQSVQKKLQTLSPERLRTLMRKLTPSSS